MRTRSITRRTFTRSLALGAAAAALPAGALLAVAGKRLKVGHTGITWGFKPTDAEQAIADVGSLGFAGYESFGNVLEFWDKQGGLKRLLDAAQVPLRSAYCPVNLTDPAKRADEIAKLVRWGRLIQAAGGSVAVLGPNNVERPSYVFAEHKAHIVEALNDMGKALADIGVIGALHQHTGTCVETRDETYAVMEAVDTRHVKFGPDVGQLQKGGADPLKVVKDFLPAVRHVHMKDFDGGPDYLGYCPLGKGKVDVAGIASLLESSGNDLMIMCELDPSPNQPLAPLEAARINKAAMAALGYSFRT
ncbi:MAG TPA: sugar phosphate isomerase/epimerase family protein [Vicinamibacterales bacterium]|jgi:inosose dehydratase|nr:sugar phosphate isomerase/epimerase family protein [Vicinamibacterales bacterium]